MAGFNILKYTLLFFLLLFLATKICAQNAADPDPTFASTSINNSIYTSKVQSDGKILVGGEFTYTNNNTTVNRFARLNVDGTIDKSFNIGTGTNPEIGAQVNTIAIQHDKKIIIGGAFLTFNGELKNGLARLNSDGSLDHSFNTGTGFNNHVITIAIQKNGKIIIGGSFTSYNDVPKKYLIRLHEDGTLDNTFNLGIGPNNEIRTIEIQADDKIIIGGNFTSYNGVLKNYLTRLNEDGSIDNSFNIGTTTNDDGVTSIAIQTDGKILVAGGFNSINGVTRKDLVRLNADGTLDQSFNIGTINIEPQYFIWKVAIQQDGKIIIGGTFTSINNVPQSYLSRLNSDGSIDNSFHIGTGVNYVVFSITTQADGKIIIAGAFSSYQNTTHNFIVRLYGDSPLWYNSIKGLVYNDTNKDCQFQISDNTIRSVVIKALPGPYYGFSNNYGKYQIRVDTGTINYTLTQEYNSIQSKLLINKCIASHNVSLKGAYIDTSSFDFSDSIRQCALLNINVQKAITRRCFRSTTYVNYCNYGNKDATGTQIKIVYPPFIRPISSVPMWTSKQDSIIIFDVGTVADGYCGTISLIDSVICGNESIRGLTQCIKASISPASNCLAENPSWDRSSMKVTGSCINNNAELTIHNSGTGNMADSLQYRVFVNDTLIFVGNFKLNTGESLKIKYPTIGQTIRLEADQHPLHPGKSRPRTTLEGCGVTNPGFQRKGLVITSPPDDLDEDVATTCDIIRDSYDPNDKLAIPLGVGSAHNVSPGQELEYTIRFQNTGNDEAYTIKVIDTLDINLDVASFIPGASSHPFTLDVSGKGKAICTFNFYNISLPAKSINELESNGLVSFRIKIPSTTPLGTVIRNKAYIYFDYNSPIITNETMHTVDNTIEEDFSRGSLVQVGEVINGLNKRYNSNSVKIYPNPSSGNITVENTQAYTNSELRIVSITGVIQKSIHLTNNTIQQVSLEGVRQGMYLYEIWEEGERKSGGMLQVK